MKTLHAKTFICSICFIGAAVLMYFDKTGWGWLVFAGLVSLVG